MMSQDEQQSQWTVTDWQGKMLIDRDGRKLGKLRDVYVDVEDDQPRFATIKEGIFGKHLTFVPLAGMTIGPDALQAGVSRKQVRSAPNIALHGGELSQEDESVLYEHYALGYAPMDTPSKRRLARR